MEFITKAATPAETLRRLVSAVEKAAFETSQYFGEKQPNGADAWGRTPQHQRQMFQEKIAGILGMVEMAVRTLAKFGQMDPGLRDAAESLHAIDPDNHESYRQAMGAFQHKLGAVFNKAEL